MKDLHYNYNKDYNIKITLPSTLHDDDESDIFNINSKEEDEFMNVTLISKSQTIFDLFIKKCEDNNININDIISIHFYLSNINDYYTNILHKYNEKFDKSTPAITLIQHNNNNNSIIETVIIKV